MSAVNSPKGSLFGVTVYENYQQSNKVKQSEKMKQSGQAVRFLNGSENDQNKTNTSSFENNNGKFYIDKEQRIKIREWYVKLPECDIGAIGGRLRYEFTPTSLGTVLKVTDSFSKTQIDVTDYKSW